MRIGCRAPLGVPFAEFFSEIERVPNITETLTLMIWEQITNNFSEIRPLVCGWWFDGQNGVNVFNSVFADNMGMSFGNMDNDPCCPRPGTQSTNTMANF